MKGSKQSRTDLLEKKVQATINIIKQLLDENAYLKDLAVGTLEMQKQHAVLDAQNLIGKLRAEKQLLEKKYDNQEIDLEKALENLQTEEKKFLDLTTQKYGQGSLNPETGVFTPNKS